MGRNFSSIGDLTEALRDAVRKKTEKYRDIGGKKILIEMAKEAEFLEYGTKKIPPRGFVRKAKAANGATWGRVILDKGVADAADRIVEDIKESMSQNGLGKEMQASVVGKVVDA